MAKRNSKKMQSEITDAQIKKLEAAFSKSQVEWNRKDTNIEAGKLVAYYDALGNNFILLDIPTGTEVYSTKYPGGIVKRVEAVLLPQASEPAKVTIREDGALVSKKRPNKKLAGGALKNHIEKRANPKPEQPRRKTKSELRREKNVPVEDKEVKPAAIIARASEPVEFTKLKDGDSGKIIEGFKGIKNTQRDKVVSVVSDTYNLLPNKSVVDPILNYLEKENVNYKLDRFSYVTDQRMRLHLTFPDIKIADDSKEGILSSVFIHNSYNMVESFRLVAGAMRQVCSNGMVIGQVIQRLKIVHKAHHITEVAAANIDTLIGDFYTNAKLVEQRIQEMIEEKTVVKTLIQISKAADAKVFSHLMRALGLADEETSNRDVVRNVKDLNPDMVITQSQWEVYNILNQYISHYVAQRYRVDYLRRLSRAMHI